VTMGPSPTSSAAVGWYPTFSQTPIADIGVSQGSSFIARRTAVASYPPGSAFEFYTVGISPPFPPTTVDAAMNITVTGTAAFAGQPGTANCHGQSVAAVARQFGGLKGAAAALGFPSVQALQEAIRQFCTG
jgi:hypothetical protein